MPNRSSAIATLRGWEHNSAGASRKAVEALLVSCGYAPAQAADYPAVILYQKTGWPRWTVLTTSDKLAAEVLHRMITKLIPLLEQDHTP